jgi:ribonuclease PH
VVMLQRTAMFGHVGAEPQFVEVQGTAEGAAFTRHELDQLLALAEGGLGEIMELQAEMVSTPPEFRKLGR